MAEALGLKRSQLDGVRHENQNLIEALEVDPNHIRKLAESYLKQQGVAVPEEEYGESQTEVA